MIDLPFALQLIDPLLLAQLVLLSLNPIDLPLILQPLVTVAQPAADPVVAEPGRNLASCRVSERGACRCIRSSSLLLLVDLLISLQLSDLLLTAQFFKPLLLTSLGLLLADLISHILSRRKIAKR